MIFGTDCLTLFCWVPDIHLQGPTSGGGAKKKKNNIWGFYHIRAQNNYSGGRQVSIKFSSVGIHPPRPLCICMVPKQLTYFVLFFLFEKYQGDIFQTFQLGKVSTGVAVVKSTYYYSSVCTSINRSFDKSHNLHFFHFQQGAPSLTVKIQLSWISSIVPLYIATAGLQ